MADTPPLLDNEPRTTKTQLNIRTVLSLYGGLFLVVFAALIVIGIYNYLNTHSVQKLDPYETVLIFAALVVAFLAMALGAKVMMAENAPPKIVIPALDRSLLEELIRGGNEKGIDQYVRLSSLAGTTGTATKLGLTGLPLATVGLTIFFAIGAIFHLDGYLDLTKLTLGAFIGSFVQRNVTGEKIASEGIKIVAQNSPPGPQQAPAGAEKTPGTPPVNPTGSPTPAS